IPGGMTTSLPVRCVRFLNNLYVFAQRDTDGLLFYNTFDGTGWSAWNHVPWDGPNLAASAAIECNQLHLFRTFTNAVAQQVFDGTNWSGFSSVPGNSLAGIMASAANY